MNLKMTALLLAIVAIAPLACKRETPSAVSQPAATGTSTPPSTQPTGEPAADSGSFPALGTNLPVMALAKLDGTAADLRHESGKALLVNLWATWCGPCRAEIPDLEAVQNQFKGQNFEVVGISVDTSGTEQSVRDFVAEQKMTYPVLLDPEGKSIEVFKTSVIPTSVLVDRSGKVVWFQRGTVNPEDAEFKTALQTALKTAG